MGNIGKSLQVGGATGLDKAWLDSMDVNESNFVANATNAMGQFQSTKVVPEIDPFKFEEEIESSIDKHKLKEFSIIKQGL